MAAKPTDDELRLSEKTSRPPAEPAPVAAAAQTTTVIGVDHAIARIDAWFRDQLAGKYPLALEQEIATKLTQLKQELRGL